MHQTLVQSRWRVFDEPDASALASYLTGLGESAPRGRPLPASPEQFGPWQARLRARLRKAMALPGPTGSPPEARMTGVIELAFCRVERVALRTEPGMYAVANLYLPRGLTHPAPAILVLFGHGDRVGGYARVATEYARQGYVVLTTEPYGGGETGHAPPWNDYHGGLPAAALVASGQPLNGLVVHNHVRALDYLCSRPEVDASRIGVTGVSGGGTHSMWLSALDDRVVAAVSGANPWVTQPDWYFRHHCPCDTAPGLFEFGDENGLVGAACPTAWLRIHLAPEVTEFSHEQLRARQAPAEQVYAAAGAGERIAMLVVDSPHAYSPQVQAAASEWFARWLGPRETPVPAEGLPTEPPGPEAFMAWPADRPADILTPTQLAQQQIRRILMGHSRAPKDAAEAERVCRTTRTRLLEALGCSGAVAGTVREVSSETTGALSVRRLALDIGGIELPFLLARPSEGAERPPVALLLHSGGKAAVREWGLTAVLLEKGWAVIAPDLLNQGEVRGDFESASYLGLRDNETCTAAVVLGQSLAGWWSQQVLALARWARTEPDLDATTVAGVAEGETGLALLAAGAQSDALTPLVFVNVLASYDSPEGYGKAYVYGGDNTAIGGIGSHVWYVPGIVSAGDIDHFTGILSPRPVMVARPRAASGRALSHEELQERFVWSRGLWTMQRADRYLRVTGSPDPDEIALWLREHRHRGHADAGTERFWGE